MPDQHPLAERGRALEEEYFRKKDRELIEKIQQAAAAEQAREALSSTSGLKDPQLLRELGDLGFTPETVGLLPIVPIIQIAWAEGGVSPAERDLLIELSTFRGGRATMIGRIAVASFAPCSMPVPPPAASPQTFSWPTANRSPPRRAAFLVLAASPARSARCSSGLPTP